MCKKGYVFLVSVIIISFLFTSLLMGKSEKDILKKNHGKPWRIAYCESGEFVNYASTLHALIRGLAELGWIKADGLPFTVGQKDTREMWYWMTSHDIGPYIEFVPDAYYSLENMNGIEMTGVAEGLIQRLNEKQDIDLMIVMGTQAGKLLANDLHQVPTLVFSVSNAVQAGIIQSINDSGENHIWAHVEPGRYERQIEIFHDLFAFKKLGMVYEDSPDGRGYAALEDVQKVANKRGFKIYSVFVKDKQGDKAAHQVQMIAAYHKLVNEGVDAVYSTLYIDRNVAELAELFQPLYEDHIPIFAQMGVDEVKNGSLLSVYRSDFMGLGSFGAHIITEVFSGVNPRELTQVYENTPSIVLNLKVAKKINYNPPFEVLLVADEIY